MLTARLRRNKSRGWSGLLLMTVTSAVLLIVVVSTYSKVSSVNRLSHRTLDYKNALAVAEAGAERAMAELNRTSGQWVAWNVTSDAYVNDEILRDHENRDFGSFSVSVSKADADMRTIVSTGVINGPAGTVRRTVRVSAQREMKRSPFGEFGLFSHGTIVMAVGVKIDSYSSAAGLYNVNGNKASDAAVAAKDNVIMALFAQILGNLQTGGSVLQLIGTGVSGTVTQHSQPTPPPPFPTDEMNAAASSNNNAQVAVYNKTLLGAKGSLAGYPLQNGNRLLTLSANQIAEFPAGNYYLEGITLAVASDIEVVGGGKAKVYLNGVATVGALSKINANTKDPKAFSLFCNSLVNVAGVVFEYHGGLYAPNASLTGIAGGTKFFGALTAGAIAFAGLVEIHQDKELAKPIKSAGYLPSNWMESTPQ
jgi:hypothetical protein